MLLLYMSARDGPLFRSTETNEKSDAVAINPTDVGNLR